MCEDSIQFQRSIGSSGTTTGAYVQIEYLVVRAMVVYTVFAFCDQVLDISVGGISDDQFGQDIDDQEVTPSREEAG